LKLPKAPVNTTAVGLMHGSAVKIEKPHEHVTVPDEAKVAKGDEGNRNAAPSSAPSSSLNNVANAAKSTAATFKRVTSSDQYQVQRGDTLMAIAATHYGTRSAWRMILSANSDAIPDKDHIKPGTVIKLPAE